ncbi:MAG: peroxiredoxin family protein [Actinomycetota bacterium]|nr:peroxiredoxin family protein [Actinomycetota bacterium]
MATAEVTTYTVGDRVQDFVLPDLDGLDVSLSDVAGKWTVLYFTATWCPYCTAEAPSIENEVVSRFEDRELRLIVVDVKEPPETARQLPDRFGWESPFLLDTTGEVSTRFAPKKEGLPPEVAIINAHVVLDAELVIRYAEYLNMERFDAHVTSLVEALERLTR